MPNCEPVALGSANGCGIILKKKDTIIKDLQLIKMSRRRYPFVDVERKEEKSREK